MNATRSFSLSTVLIVALIGSGCALFRAGELPPVTDWPPQPSKVGDNSISLVVTGNLKFNGKDRDVSSAMIENWSERAEKEYRHSNLFSDVKIGLAETDIRANIHITDDGKGSMALAFLTGLTLYLLPSKASDRLTVETTFTNARGDVLGKLTKTETLTLWQQIVLIFVLPFKFPPSETNAAFADLHRATLVEAHAAGIF